MKKILAILFILLVASTLIFASGAKEDEKIELDFWTWRTEDVDFYDKVIKLYQERNPNVVVNQLAYKNTEYNSILMAALQGGEGPDVFMGRAYGGLYTISSSGFAVAMDDKIDLSKYNKNTLEGSMNIDDKKHYGVPALSQVIFCYYNKRVYDELGLSIPKTFSEFKDNLAKTQKAGYIGLANGSKDAWTVETLMGGVGPNFYGANDFYYQMLEGKKNFLDKDFIKAIEAIKELTPYMPKLYNGVGYSDMQSSFFNEKAAHMIGGSYEAGNFSKNNPDLEFGIFAIPSREGGSSVTYYADMNWVVNNNSKKQEAAIDFVKFLASKEVSQMIINDLKMISSTPGVDASSEPFIEEVLNLMKDSTNYIFLVPFRYHQPTGSSLWQNAGQGFLNGTLSAYQAAKSVQDGIASYYKPFQK